MKAMIKQIKRVTDDMKSQVFEFRHGGNDPISLGIVGLNYASQATSYEGDRQYQTDGKTHKHPIQEAAQVKTRLEIEVRPSYDEFLFLEFKACKVEPYLFEWLNPTLALHEYAAILTRISRKYDRKF